MADKDFDKVLRDNACGVRKNAKVPEDVLKILKPNPLPVRQEDGADVVYSRAGALRDG